MAQFSIDINDEMLETVFESFAAEFNYDANKLVTSDGAGQTIESKQDFTRRKVIEWIKKITVSQAAQKAAEVARQAAAAAAEQNLVIE